MSLELEFPHQRERKVVAAVADNEIECILCKVKIKIQQATNYNEHSCPRRTDNDTEVVFVQSTN
jgi:hypothetical protein